MRFIGDIPIASSTIALLRSLGHDAISAANRLPPTASDDQIVQLAVAERRTIICFDLDFATLVALSGETLPSVVTFRTLRSDADAVNQRLRAILPGIGQAIERGALITVEDNRVRVRSLPLDFSEDLHEGEYSEPMDHD